jgi:hypothetical protein
VLDDEHPEDDLDRGRRPARRKGLRIALAEIGFDLLKDEIIIEQGIDLRDHRFDRVAQLRHHLENIDRIVTIT